MAEHTPVPWEHGSRGNARFVVYGGKAVHGKAICVMRSTQADPPDHPLNLEADANAEFIVQACNAHDDLLAACQEGLGFIEAWIDLHTTPGPHLPTAPGDAHTPQQSAQLIKAALAKAKGI